MYELTGDQSSMIVTISLQINIVNERRTLYITYEKWDHVIDTLENSIELKIPLKTSEYIENAVLTPKSTYSEYIGQCRPN